MDNDGDLEFILGSTQTLLNIDIKEPGSTIGMWSTMGSKYEKRWLLY